MGPYYQDIPILDPDVISGKLTKFIGASGDVSKTAPLPPIDLDPGPYTLIAVI